MVHRLRHTQAGFSLVEVMVAATVLMVGVLGTVSMVDASSDATTSNNRREVGVATARDIVEAARAVPYATVLEGGAEAQIKSQAGLSDADGATGWQVKRGGVTFTIALTTCTIDDPGDGAGSHASGGFCPDTIAAGTVDPKPADYSRMNVRVTWPSPRGGTDGVTQSTVVNNTFRGPRVTSITQNPAANPITASATTSISFTATTAPAADRLEWMVDGKYRGSGTSYVWPIGQAYGGPPCTNPPTSGIPSTSMIDGTYQIGAQAFDAANTTFGPYYVPVKLNRCAPLAVRGLQGGRTGVSNQIELKWIGNAEDDVIGYKILRSNTANGTYTEVGAATGATCSGLVKKTTCVDADPNPSQTLYYKVVAYDMNGSVERPGRVMTTPLTVGTGNRPPGTPTIYAATYNGQDYGTLFWQPVTDPDAGDAVDFYRIYRDGVLYDTYDWTGGQYVLWTDEDPEGVTHEYYITAVDTRLRASAPSNKVTK